MSSRDTPGSLGTEEVLLVEFARVVEPLDAAVQAGPDGVGSLLKRATGERSFRDDELETVRVTVLEDLAGPLETVRTQVLDPIREGDGVDVGALDIAELTAAIGDVYAGIQRLRRLDFQAIDGTEFAERVRDYLLVRYLRRYHRRTHNTLCLVGVIVEGGPPTLDLSKLPEFLRDPTRVPAEAFGWGTESFTPFLVLYYLDEICWRFGLPSTLTEMPVANGEDGATEADRVEHELTVPVVSVVEERGSTTLGVRIVPMPGKPENNLPGVAVVPFGLTEASETFDLDGWTFNVESSVEKTDWRIGVWPDPESESPRSELLGEGDHSSELSLDASLERDAPGTGRDETLLLGRSDGSRIAVRYVELEASIMYDGDEAVFRVALPTRGTLAIDPEDLDDFLASLLPPNGLDYDFDVTVGWSSNRGLFFERGSGLEATLPQQQRVGPITLTELYLGVVPSEDADEVLLEGSASADVEIGPVSGTVSRFGLAAELGFPEDGTGNLGPVDLDVGVTPPNGIAISVDASAVTGGGFLNYDPENERYAGIVTLKLGELTINAIGLLSTDVPGDIIDYSLLVIITGEFPPIRLGLGFSLTGAGGVVGLHRSVKSEALGDAVRNGSLDSVLFPEDPVANADRIVSDLREVFPVTRDTHTFGPVLRIEWGSPTMLTADLAVVFELPSWKIAVLGDFQAILPDEEADLLTLNMAAAGTIVPDEERIDVDASLYDSRLVTWTLTGDMVLRTRRGDDPRFVLSVGGFNPRFDPPSTVPTLDRVKATLGPSTGTPTLEYAGYFAITANTLQAGAVVHAIAEAGPATVEGTLSFDTLIQFDPFEFVADFNASFRVEVKGKGLSITIDGTISGPGPLRIHGAVKIDLFLFSISANLDVRLGSGVSTELPRARIMPKLEEALGRPANWEARHPREGDGFAVLPEIEDDPDSIAVHPLAELGVRQTVVPLDLEIETFGEASPSGYTRFELAGATVADASLDLTTETTEYFAPAQYTKLSDAERLDSPAFERYPAGRKLRDRGIYLGYDGDRARGDNLRESALEYTCFVFDLANERDGISLQHLGGFPNSLSGFEGGSVEALQEVGAVADSPARRAGSRRFRLSEEDKRRAQEITDGKRVSRVSDTGEERLQRGGANPDIGGLGGKISMTDDRYVIVEAGSLRPVSIPTAPDSEMSKAAAKRALSRYRKRIPTHARALRVVNAGNAAVEGLQ